MCTLQQAIKVMALTLINHPNKYVLQCSNGYRGNLSPGTHPQGGDRGVTLMETDFTYKTSLKLIDTAGEFQEGAVSPHNGSY